MSREYGCPCRKTQTVAALDVICLDGIPCLDTVSKCTRWSETAALRRSILDQISAFMNIQVQRHSNRQRINGTKSQRFLKYVRRSLRRIGAGHYEPSAGPRRYDALEGRFTRGYHMALPCMTVARPLQWPSRFPPVLIFY